MEQNVDAVTFPTLNVPMPQMVGQTVGAALVPLTFLIPSRLLKCPRSRCHPALHADSRGYCRRRNSWWKCHWTLSQGSGLSSRSLTFQLCAVPLERQGYSPTAEQIVDNPVPRRGLDEGLQGFSLQDSVQQRVRSRPFTFQFRTVARMTFILRKQRIFQIRRVRRIMLFFAFFRGTKKCEDPAHSVVRECSGSRAHGLHELSWRLGVLYGKRHGVRSLLLFASGRVVWAGRCSSWSPLLPSGPEVIAGV